MLKLVFDFNNFSFPNCKIKPNPNHLPKHHTLSPNHQFSQRILYVESCSVHARMAWSEKYRLTLVIQPPTLLYNVLFLLTSLVQNVCVYTLWTSCLRAKMHYYYIWPFAEKLYQGWISTMTSSNEILWKLPSLKWRAGCAPAARWSWRLTSVHVFQVHYIAVCEKPELKNWYAFHLMKYVWRWFEVRGLKVACSLIPLHAHWLRWE